MKHSDSLAKLAPSLVAAQSELRAIGKDSSNTEFRSQYASLDHVIASVRPILSRHGLAVVQGSEETDDSNMLTVETQLIHTSGEWLATTVVMPLIGRMLKGGERAEPDPQAGGSALSYGRRYGLVALLCLSTGEDDDGNAASPQPPARQAERPPVQSAEPQRSAPKADAEKTWPFGEKKGQKLGAFDTPELNSMLAWCRDKKKDDIAQAIQNVLNERLNAQDGDRGEQF